MNQVARLPEPFSVDRLTQAGLESGPPGNSRPVSEREKVTMDKQRQDEREARAARNQAIFRAVNEKMAALNESFGELTGMFSVACECADTGCVQLLDVPPEAYRHVRENPRTFVVASDHVFEDVELVVSRHDGYTVVEAIGPGAQIAEATFRDEQGDRTFNPEH